MTTYGGDSVKQYGNLFFQDLKAKMEESNNAISLTPALTQYSTTAQKIAIESAAEMIRNFPAADGYFNWQAWPVDDNVKNTCTADKAYHSALQNAGKSGAYIMAISPWQFKDLDNGDQMDAWVALSDWLFVKRLEAVDLGDIKPDIVELLTWNNWCESHYLRDLPGNYTSASDHADMGTMGAYGCSDNEYRVLIIRHGLPAANVWGGMFWKGLSAGFDHRVLFLRVTVPRSRPSRQQWLHLCL